MNLTSKIWIGIKALGELGAEQVGLNALYQLGLRSGHYQRMLNAALRRLEEIHRSSDITLQPCLPRLPEPEVMREVLKDQLGTLFEQADEIVDGKFRMFGGSPVPLVLTLSEPLATWTQYEFMNGRVGDQDIKFIWEPGRFGWACTLAMAFHLSRKEAYSEAFWRYSDQFLSVNPPYMGPHWCSAQEVAIRLVALAFALQVFAQRSLASIEQLEKLTRSIAVHAERIPPTLVYARSQNNNHLIMETLGLFTASMLLPQHPLATRWRHSGWRWLMNALSTQIDPVGMYTQHSANYHRLMLQAALWAFTIAQQTPQYESISQRVRSNLANSTLWLSRIIDPKTGRVPNLGHNDGAYILPLTVCPYQDYRPVLHSAAQAFTGFRMLPDGPWKDMSHWLGISHWPTKNEGKVDAFYKQVAKADIPVQPPYVLVNPASDSWGILHVPRYHSRPAHADQLHLDLWWRGLNLALDAGTYLYNAHSPWENSLVSAFVHNTVTVDGQEFMRRAGRYLYLDWAQAKILDSHYDPASKSHTLSASHNGYRKLGITHTRTVTTFQDGHWEIEDRLDGPPGEEHSIRLHWLLPDWEYELLGQSQNADFLSHSMILRSSRCKFTLQEGVMRQPDEAQYLKKIDIQLARAGELLIGQGSVLPIVGYYSPTYGVKTPALAYILNVMGSLPITLKSQWSLPREKAAVILIKNDQIALIERHRTGRHYFVIPGGKIEPGETPEKAAVREAKEELGLEVKIGRLVAKIWYQGRTQHYFLAEEIGGAFGHMTGPEMNSLPGLQKGTYLPIWMNIDELPNQPVLPELVADLVWKSHHHGWPEAPLDVPEPHRDEEI